MNWVPVCWEFRRDSTCWNKKRWNKLTFSVVGGIFLNGMKQTIDLWLMNYWVNILFLFSPEKPEVWRQIYLHFCFSDEKIPSVSQDQIQKKCMFSQLIPTLQELQKTTERIFSLGLFSSTKDESTESNLDFSFIVFYSPELQCSF